MKIVHAVCDENGAAKGGIVGDQTGNEIRESSWYSKPWDCYLEPKDKNLGSKAAEIAKQICSGNFGYNQEARWSGYQSIKKNGVENAVGDFDCSSLVVSCYILAGADLLPRGYTGNLERILVESGLFTAYHDDHLLNPDKACAGGLYIRKNAHVIMCVENVDDLKESVYITAKGSVRVRKAPVTGATVRVLHKGDKELISGQDDETGWYHVVDGWVTNNKRYIY